MGLGLGSRFKAAAAAFRRGADPAGIYADTASVAGFLQTPTNPAPDAVALRQTDEISAIIARCIDVISEDASHVPLRLMDVSGEQPREIFDHPAIRLVRHINPVDTQTVYFSQMYADLLAEGNHFSFLDRDAAGVPINMIRIPPEQVEVLPDKRRIIGGYRWKPDVDVRPQDYDRDDIIHVKTRNPASQYRGIGKLARLRDQILLDRQMRAWRLNQFTNGIPTSMIVKVSRMFADEAQWDRFKQEMWERLRGVQNSGKPMFIRAGDVEVTPISRPTDEELAFYEGLKFTRNEFACLFGVPPSRLSDYSESFRANASEQSRTYWQDTIMSWHRLFIEYMNSVFLPTWFRDGRARDGRTRLAFAYDYSQVRALALSMRDMAMLNEILVRNAMRTPNEAAISMGDAAHDDPAADQLYMNGKPLGQTEESAPPAAMPEGPAGEEDDDGTTGRQALFLARVRANGNGGRAHAVPK